MKKIACILSALFLFSSNLLAATVEPILDAKITEKGLELKVSSNGCTKKEHFLMERIEGTKQVQLLRTKRDPCKMVSHSIWIAFTFDEVASYKGEDLVLRDGKTFRLNFDRAVAHVALPTSFSCEGKLFKINVYDSGDAINVGHGLETYAFRSKEVRIGYNANSTILKMQKSLSQFELLNMALEFPVGTKFDGQFEGTFRMKKTSFAIGGTIDNDPNMRPPTQETVICSLNMNEDL